MIDPVHEHSLVHEIEVLKARITDLERGRQFVPQVLSMEPKVERQGAWFESSALSPSYDTIMIGRIPLTAQWLHYAFSVDHTLVTGTFNIRITAAVPSKLVVLVYESTTESGSYEDSVDVLSALGNQKIYYGDILTIKIQGNINGSGTGRFALDNSTLLKAKET